jgi:hypothetical protein
MRSIQVRRRAQMKPARNGKSTMLVKAVTLVVVGGVCFANASPVEAADKEFAGFWQNFKQALKTNDKSKILSMTQCPFFLHKQLNQKELAGQIEKIFTPKVRNCLVQQHPVKGQPDSYSCGCAELIYTFTKINGHFMFTDLDAND